MLSSIASEQAKYRQFLVDWLVGFALLFIMHYIMAFLMSFNTLIVDMLSNEEGDTYYVGIAELDSGDWTSKWYRWWRNDADASDGTGKPKTHELIVKKIAVYGGDDADDGFSLTTNPDGTGYKNKVDMRSNFMTCGDMTDEEFTRNWEDSNFIGDSVEWANGNEYIQLNAQIYSEKHTNYANKVIYKCNIMEYARTITNFGSAFVHVWNGEEYEQLGEDTTILLENMTGIAYGIIYLVLFIETVMFLVIYIKRVLMLAFLTMIAPLIALMYPIDKVGDGKAQAFNTWFKDYLFNILLQPLHLLLYTILINGAVELINKNPLWAIAVYAYMIPAEKYFKKIFGFDKASTGGGPGLAGAVGAGMAMSGLKSLTGLGPGPGGKPPRGGGTQDDASQKTKIPKRKLGANEENQSTPNIKNTSESIQKGESPDGNGGFLPDSSSKNKKSTQAPSSDGRKNKKNHPYVTAAKRKISRAMTGGKSNTLKGHAGDALAYLGKKGSRFALRNAGRIGGGLLGGAAGILAGAATAMATGDLSKLGAGVGLGLSAGIKQGKNIGEWTAEKGIGAAGAVGSFADEVRLAKAETDDEYYKKMRAKEALAEFGDQDLTDRQTDIISRFAGDVDFNGDLDKVDAFAAIEDTLSEDGSNVTEQDTKEVYDAIQLVGNPNTEKGEKDLARYFASKKDITVDESAQQFNDDVSKEAQRLKQEQLDKAYQEREAARDKLDEAQTERQRKKAEIELEKAEKSYTKAEQNTEDQFSDAARDNVRQRIKQEKISQATEKQIRAAKAGHKKKH